MTPRAVMDAAPAGMLPFFTMVSGLIRRGNAKLAYRMVSRALPRALAWDMVDKWHEREAHVLKTGWTIEVDAARRAMLALPDTWKSLDWLGIIATCTR